MVGGQVRPAGDKAAAKGGAAPEPSWDESKKLIKQNWDALKGHDEDNRMMLPGGLTKTVTVPITDNNGDEYTVDFKSDYLIFNKDQLTWKGPANAPGSRGLEPYGVKPENLYPITDDKGKEWFLLLYEKKSDGSIEVYRRPEEHPAFRDALGDSKEKSADVADRQFQSLVRPENRAGEMSGAGGLERSAARFTPSFESWENQEIGGVIQNMHTKPAKAFVESTIAGKGAKDGVVDAGSNKPIFKAELLENRLVGTPFEGDQNVADQIAAKANYARVYIDTSAFRMDVDIPYFKVTLDGKEFEWPLPMSVQNVGSGWYYMKIPER